MNSPKLDCVACMEAKLSESPYGPMLGCPTKPGKLTHMGLWGKYDVASINGNQYYLLMVDDAACYITVKFLKTKDQAAQKVMDYMTYLKVQGKTPCAIHANRGTEFVNETLRGWCNSQGIELQVTVPYSPLQNRVAEQMNCMLVELAHAMLTASELPEFLWEATVAHTAYLRNMLYTKPRAKETPYQIWHSRKPNVSHLHEFGTPVWVLLQGQRIQRKMLPKSQWRAYVSYNKGSKSVNYYNAATKNIREGSFSFNERHVGVTLCYLPFCCLLLCHVLTNLKADSSIHAQNFLNNSSKTTHIKNSLRLNDLVVIIQL